MATDGRKKGDATREALMDAAFKVFAAKGFLRTKVIDIVREAGKSNGVFHVYFRNKDALLDAWLDRSAELVPWYHADTSLLFEKARVFILRGYWSLYESHGPIMDALEHAALISDHFEQRLKDLRQRGDAGIASMIRNAQREGRCAGIDPELTAISIASMLSNTTAYWFRHRPDLEARGFDQATAIAHLDGLYQRMLEPETIAAANDSPTPAWSETSVFQKSLEPAPSRKPGVAPVSKI